VVRRAPETTAGCRGRRGSAAFRGAFAFHGRQPRPLRRASLRQRLDAALRTRVQMANVGGWSSVRVRVIRWPGSLRARPVQCPQRSRWRIRHCAGAIRSHWHRLRWQVRRRGPSL